MANYDDCERLSKQLLAIKALFLFNEHLKISHLVFTRENTVILIAILPAFEIIEIIE